LSITEASHHLKAVQSHIDLYSVTEQDGVCQKALYPYQSEDFVLLCPLAGLGTARAAALARCPRPLPRTPIGDMTESRRSTNQLNTFPPGIFQVVRIIYFGCACYTVHKSLIDELPLGHRVIVTTFARFCKCLHVSHRERPLGLSPSPLLPVPS
jgi:hypothetical protein